MRLQRASLLQRTSLVLSMLTVTLSGCSGLDEAQEAVDDAQDLASTAQTCAALAEDAVGRIDQVRAHGDDPAKLERAARRTAAELEATMAEADDPQLKQALRTNVIQLRRVADRAEHGQTPDLGDLREANSVLVDACS
jgi:hypothetical protein